MIIIMLLSSLFLVLLIIIWYARCISVPSLPSRRGGLEACWFYQHAGKKVGPVLAVEIITAIEHGELSPDTLVWSSQLNEWKKVREVSEIADHSYALDFSVRGEKGTQEVFYEQLSLFAQDLGYADKEVAQRIALEDHTGRSCTKVLAKKVGVSAEQIMVWAKNLL